MITPCPELNTNVSASPSGDRGRSRWDGLGHDVGDEAIAATRNGLDEVPIFPQRLAQRYAANASARAFALFGTTCRLTPDDTSQFMPGLRHLILINAPRPASISNKFRSVSDAEKGIANTKPSGPLIRPVLVGEKVAINAIDPC